MPKPTIESLLAEFYNRSTTKGAKVSGQALINLYADKIRKLVAEEITTIMVERLSPHD